MCFPSLSHRTEYGYIQITYAALLVSVGVDGVTMMGHLRMVSIVLTRRTRRRKRRKKRRRKQLQMALITLTLRLPKQIDYELLWD